MNKVKYIIHIEPPKWEGYKYSLYYEKNYGDHLGGAIEFKTKKNSLNL